MLHLDRKGLTLLSYRASQMFADVRLMQKRAGLLATGKYAGAQLWSETTRLLRRKDRTAGQDSGSDGQLFRAKALATALIPDPLVSILIPVYNGLAYVRECLESVLSSPVSCRFEVIVVDQASRDGTREMLRAMTGAHANLKLIENTQNLGFAHAINQAAGHATGQFLCVSNSDVIVTPGWLDHLIAAMRDNPDYGILSPVTNYVGEGPQIDHAAQDLEPEQAREYAERVAGRMGLVPVVERLVFFCVLIRHELYALLGGLQEVYGLGNYEDADFCLRARMGGSKLGIVPGAFVFHYGSRTFREQKIPHTELMLKNEETFFERVVSLSTRAPIVRRPARAAWPSVSVIVRTKDRPFLLRQALTSLANQTYADFEVVLVNDGGVDLGALLDEFAGHLECQYVIHERSHGRSAALNAGIRAAKGKWLTYLDDDDVVYPTHLEHLATGMLVHADAAAVYTDSNKALIWSDALRRDLMVSQRTRFPQQNFDAEAMLIENWIPIMALMHPAALLETVGTFDETIDVLEDWDMFIRLSRCGRFYRIPSITCEYHFRFGEILDDSTLRSRELVLQGFHTIYGRHPVQKCELKSARSNVIEALEQQIANLNRIMTLPVPEQQRSLLIAARLGGFTPPRYFG